MEASGESELVFVECGGTSLVNSRPCFDHANKYLFCCSGKSVRVYSVDSGECVHSLSHASDVVGVIVDEESTSHILSCTVDGIFSQWNYETGSKVQEWMTPEKIGVCSFMAPKQSPGSWFVIVSGGEENQLCTFSRSRNGLTRRIICNVPDDCRKVAVHDKGHFLAYAIGKKLWIRDLLEGSPPRHLVAPGKKITFVACHPTKDSVAIGDELGRICVWHKVMGQRPIYTLYHWHSLPISDLAFSSEGTTMYSGGEEMVVVRWSLQNSSKEETKDFLPRLGAKIRFLSTSPDSSIVAVSLEDNSIHIASSQLKLLTYIQGFVRNMEQLPSSELNGEPKMEQPCFPIGLIYDGFGCGGDVTKGALIANGRPGHLQFYDPSRDTQRIVLDVIGKNQPPAERERQLSRFEVIQAAICNRWLATVDHRPDPQYSDETNLKIWEHDDQNDSFKLHTWIDSPHSGNVTSLFFRAGPNSTDQCSLISTGDDGKFKIWEISVDEKNIYSRRDCWTCDRVGYYRSQPATCGDVAADGKLGIAFGHTVTVWEFEDHRMLLAKSVLPAENVIRKLQFGVTEDESHLVAVLSDRDLAVWDIAAEVCLWRVTTPPDSLCKDVTSGLFAAFFGPKICIFRLLSPEPTHVLTATGCERPLATTFASRPTGNNEGRHLSPLYFITDTMKLMCLQRENGLTVITEQAPIIVSKKTPFARLLAESKTSKREKPVSHAPSYEANMQLLSGPAHALPAVGTIGPKFAESCLAKKANDQEDVVYPELASEVTFGSLKALYS